MHDIYIYDTIVGATGFRYSVGINCFIFDSNWRYVLICRRNLANVDRRKKTMSREVESRHDSSGKLIKLHDVLIDEDTGEMVLVVYATNKAGVFGLAVQNDITGSGDWLDVYPDGLWTIVGNAGVTSS